MLCMESACLFRAILRSLSASRHDIPNEILISLKRSSDSLALLVSVFQLGILRVPAGRALEDEPVQVADIMSALRGAWSLIGQLHPHLSQTRLSGLFTQRRNCEVAPLREDLRKALFSLDSLNAPPAGLPEDQSSRGESIQLLYYDIGLLQQKGHHLLSSISYTGHPRCLMSLFLY
jgi:hypothetical protein